MNELSVEIHGQPWWQAPAQRPEVTRPRHRRYPCVESGQLCGTHRGARLIDLHILRTHAVGDHDVRARLADNRDQISGDAKSPESCLELCTGHPPGEAHRQALRAQCLQRPRNIEPLASPIFSHLKGTRHLIHDDLVNCQCSVQHWVGGHGNNHGESLPMV